MPEETWNELDFIMLYENEDLDEETIAKGFQHLVDNGHAWSLQGRYGRTAVALIEAGLVKDTHGVLKK